MKIETRIKKKKEHLRNEIKGNSFCENKMM